MDRIFEEKNGDTAARSRSVGVGPDYLIIITYHLSFLSSDWSILLLKCHEINTDIDLINLLIYLFLKCIPGTGSLRLNVNIRQMRIYFEFCYNVYV